MKTNILVSSKESKLKRFIIGTHDGISHPDEVVACAILTLLHDNEQIEIVRSKEISYLAEKGVDIFVDVGKGNYDHHQPGGNGKRENGIPYASAGLIWKDFGRELICRCYEKLYESTLNSKDPFVSCVFELIDAKLIQEVDKEDNGIYTSLHVFSFISSFLPVYGSNYSNFDEAFKLAIDTASQILVYEIFQSIARLKTKKDLCDMIKNNGIINDHILEIPSQAFPWLESVTYHNNISSSFENWNHIYFVIFPYLSGGWAAQCVPPSFERKFDQIAPFPKEWAGQTDKLPEISGVEDATFCHNGCFFVQAKSREGVIALCNKAQENNENNV